MHLSSRPARGAVVSSKHSCLLHCKVSDVSPTAVFIQSRSPYIVSRLHEQLRSVPTGGLVV